MAIVCLSRTISELKERIDRIVIGQNYARENVTFGQLKCTGAIAALLKDVIKPNLVQTLEKNPAFVHGGPFANIAHGCHSVNATLCALATGDYVVTEAGFAADLGAEKFLDIKCRAAGFKPDAIVMVATIRALKMHGGQPFEELANEDVEALKKGVCNLKRHLENMGKYDVPMIIAINHFASDSKAEIEYLESWCKEEGYEVSFLDGFLEGGKGAVDLAKKVQKMLKEKESHYHPIYELDRPLKEKINTICREIYRAGEVIYTEKAEQQLAEYEKLGFGDAYICMAKTPQSVTDDAKILGAPSGFPITIREVNLSAGARFVIPLTGKILTMPGLPKVPAAVKMEDMPWRE
jgi:formate--tetrahydrofolate ligase